MKLEGKPNPGHFGPGSYSFVLLEVEVKRFIESYRIAIRFLTIHESYREVVSRYVYDTAKSVIC